MSDNKTLFANASLPATGLKRGFSRSITASASLPSPGTPDTRKDILQRVLCTPANFRDYSLLATADADVLKGEPLDLPTYKSLQHSGGVQKNKLVIVMVGLPGRGKSYISHKLMCYLNWLGHNTRNFNVGNYRRTLKPEGDIHDASFFDATNEAGLKARNLAVNLAVDDMLRYLASADGQVAILDATNTTRERRSMLRSHLHGKCQYMFIEVICNDSSVIDHNIRLKLQYSPDYQGVDKAQAFTDFKTRITKYEEVYEPIDDRTLHYIKLIDMVTGRGHMDVNRISGYIAGKITFFLMQICRAGITNPRKIWLSRHGESEFNKLGKIGGDSGLSENGKAYALQLAEILEARVQDGIPEGGAELPGVSVWTSTLQRTIQTAAHIRFPKLRLKALDEISAGTCDGMAYEEIKTKFPDEYKRRDDDKLRYRYPSGESYLDVIQRLEGVVMEVERERDCVCIVAHQAVLRVLYGYFVAVPQEKIPTQNIPLHEVLELTPLPDGRMMEQRFKTRVATSGPHSSDGGAQPTGRVVYHTPESAIEEDSFQH